MGIGKSSSLLDYLRFGAFYFKDESYIESLRRTGLFNDLQKARFIIFVSTIRERDERFLQELNAKCPGEPPYNKNILDRDDTINKYENWTLPFNWMMTYSYSF